MITINIHEAKTHLSQYLARLEKGESIILCRRNIPIAEIRPISHPSSKPRPLGLAKGKLTIPDAFFKPLPNEIIEGFHGKS
jgi:antitoxin (DNA-binding transcriptional repressor) of toxin-antitoxin stability system